jgi:hypothetical protein
MVQVAMLKCVPILNVLLLAVGIDAFGTIKACHLMCQGTQGIWDYMVMDVTTYPAWNGATVALLADVTNQPQNTAAPTSESPSSRPMWLVTAG